VADRRRSQHDGGAQQATPPPASGDSRLAQDASLDDGVDSEALLDGTAARADDARRALATLRDDDRNVIELCVMGELSPSTVAMLLGQRSSTVRSRLARARRRLADAYTRVSDPDTR
jgi:RNA polymerase sigma-70 factor (ECF subfamily)